MSKAFTRESDEDSGPDIPDREISAFPNLVTAEGLAKIDAEIARHSHANADALSAGNKDAAARAARELRYWTARRNTAHVQPAPTSAKEVRFGSAVTLTRADGRTSSYRIVGEDEADPAKGLLSWVSPLARAMMGRSLGEDIEAGATEATITAIMN